MTLEEYDRICQDQTINPLPIMRNGRWCFSDGTPIPPEQNMVNPYVPRASLDDRFASFKRRLAAAIARRGLE